MTELANPARHPSWQQRATPEELSEVEIIDQSIAELRRRRQSIVNRTKMRTQIWVERRLEPRRRRSLGHRTRSDR
jgi:hypothetical protein